MRYRRSDTPGATYFFTVVTFRRRPLFAVGAYAAWPYMSRCIRNRMRQHRVWFRLVNRMGWYWIGRIRNRDMVSPADDDTWTGCKTLYARAPGKAKSLCRYNYVRNHPVPCMQIEESFRDLKSERFGLGFSSARSTQKDRWSVLLLVACLTSFVLRLIGEVGKAKQLDFQFQSNTRRSRPVLSVITLALQLVR